MKPRIATTRQLEQLTRDGQETARNVQENTKHIRILSQIAEASLDSVKRLENIATAHQNRLNGHETRIGTCKTKISGCYGICAEALLSVLAIQSVWGIPPSERALISRST